MDIKENDVIHLCFDEVVRLMQHGGCYRLYSASVKADCHDRLTKLWSLLVTQFEKNRSSTGRCLLHVKTPPQAGLTIPELYDLTKWLEEIFPQQVTWGYSIASDDKMTLEIIG